MLNTCVSFFYLVVPMKPTIKGKECCWNVFFKDFRLQSRSQCQCQAADHLLLPQTKSDKEQIELRTSRFAGWAEITTVKGFTKADDHKKNVKLFSHRYLNLSLCLLHVMMHHLEEHIKTHLFIYIKCYLDDKLALL